jgi:hypothetical protein
VSSVKEANPSLEFYKLVREVPADVYYNQLASKSVNELLDEFKHRYQQAKS